MSKGCPSPREFDLRPDNGHQPDRACIGRSRTRFGLMAPTARWCPRPLQSFLRLPRSPQWRNEPLGCCAFAAAVGDGEVDADRRRHPDQRARPVPPLSAVAEGFKIYAAIGAYGEVSDASACPAKIARHRSDRSQRGCRHVSHWCDAAGMFPRSEKVVPIRVNSRWESSPRATHDNGDEAE